MANPNRGEVLQKSLVKRGKLLYNTSQKDADMDQEKDQYEIPEVLLMLPLSMSTVIIDGFVKSPTSALRCILRHCSVL